MERDDMDYFKGVFEEMLSCLTDIERILMSQFPLEEKDEFTND